MEEFMDKKLFLASVAAVSEIHIPRWNELPEFELYMDQVIGLAEKNLGALYIDGKGLLTPSMINNYVKSGVLPPPKNKRYNRTHLAILMIVCAMKPVMEISAVSDIISRSIAASNIENVLDEFARMYESELSSSIKTEPQAETDKKKEPAAPKKAAAPAKPKKKPAEAPAEAENPEKSGEKSEEAP